MPRTTRSTPEAASPETRRAAALRAAADHNYTAERVLRALEVVVFRPSSAPAVAAALGVHPRTARRILLTLTKERYVERRGRGGAAHDYQPTVRLLVTATQLAARLPLVQHGRRAVRAIELETSLTAYLAVPCYADVLVIACTGERALRPWATLPAPADAAGHILLAHREAWRQSLVGDQPQAVLDEKEAASIAARGHALIAAGDQRTGSLAVLVPATDNPIAALGLRGPSSDLIAEKQLLVELLHRRAAPLAEP